MLAQNGHFPDKRLKHKGPRISESTNACFDSENGHLTKIKKLYIQNGGRSSSGILLFCYISTNYCPDNAKFGMKKLNNSHVIKIANFQNSRWRTLAILHFLLSDIYWAKKRQNDREIGLQ